MKSPYKKNYPKEVVIGDNAYKIKLVKGLKHRRKEVAGLYVPLQLTIYLNRDQDRDELFKTFIHEILHAMEVEYGFILTHKMIEVMEDAFSDFILDNFG